MVLFLDLVQMPSAPLMLKFGHLISVVCDVACMGGKVGSKPQTFFFFVSLSASGSWSYVSGFPGSSE